MKNWLIRTKSVGTQRDVYVNFTQGVSKELILAMKDNKRCVKNLYRYFASYIYNKTSGASNYRIKRERLMAFSRRDDWPCHILLSTRSN